MEIPRNGWDCLDEKPSRSMHGAAGKGMGFLLESSKADVCAVSFGRD